jgi:hypothetical protein
VSLSLVYNVLSVDEIIVPFAKRTHVHSIGDVRVVQEINASKLLSAPAWDPLEEEVPMTISNAIDVARDAILEYQGNANYDLLESVTLWHFLGTNKWYYDVVFSGSNGFAGMIVGLNKVIPECDISNVQSSTNITKMEDGEVEDGFVQAVSCGGKYWYQNVLGEDIVQWPLWNPTFAKLPLDIKSAVSTAKEGLKGIGQDGKQFIIERIVLKRITSNRYYYVISFVRKGPDGLMEKPTAIVVTMDGKLPKIIDGKVGPSSDMKDSMTESPSD